MRKLVQTALFATTVALALPGEAAPQTCPVGPAPVACSATAPSPGQAFSGPVLQVLDGRTLCVALGPSPSQWVRVAMADAGPDATLESLRSLVFARKIDCMTVGQEGGAVRAVCLMDGLPVGLLASPVPGGGTRPRGSDA
ncbi:MAG: hypothetical protein JO127_05095 [Caulobacteraceae bacterium]|nr:hypothetical protein [Caulobacteraceae bacterium]